MSVLPEDRLAQIQFCEAHNPVWAANAVAIGLTAAQVTALTTQTTAARAKYNAAQAAREASKGATTDFYNVTRTMVNTVRDLILLIKTTAETKNDPGIYAIAQIPPPAAPTPATAPGEAQNIIVTLNPGGSLSLSWEASDASASSGAFFSVSRRLGGAGQTGFTVIGGAPGATTQQRRPSFTDATLPLGTQTATYIIRGQRGTLLGQASEAVTVQFGVGGGTLTVTGGELALAA